MVGLVSVFCLIIKVSEEAPWMLLTNISLDGIVYNEYCFLTYSVRELIWERVAPSRPSVTQYSSWLELPLFCKII